MRAWSYVVAALVLAAWSGVADAGLTCGRSVVLPGASASEVLAKCGSPTSRRGMDGKARSGGARGKGSGREIWVYDLGSRQLVRYLTFDKGRLVADMIRGKRLRPLATLSDRPLELEGYGTIEPITKAIPSLKTPINYFGLFVPKGVPAEVVATMDRLWGEAIAKSETLKKYAANRGALFSPLVGDAAQKAVFPAVQANAWLMHASGKAKVSPDSVGIPKPAP